MILCLVIQPLKWKKKHFWLWIQCLMWLVGEKDGLDLVFFYYPHESSIRTSIHSHFKQEALSSNWKTCHGIIKEHWASCPSQWLAGSQQPSAVLGQRGVHAVLYTLLSWPENVVVPCLLMINHGCPQHLKSPFAEFPVLQEHLLCKPT